MHFRPLLVHDTWQELGASSNSLEAKRASRPGCTCVIDYNLGLGCSYGCPESLSGKVILILSQAEETLIKHHIDLIDRAEYLRWHRTLSPKIITQSLRSSLVACALAFNFSEYIAAKLSTLHGQDPAVTNMISTRMLSARLYPGADGFSLEHLPRISMRMASVLIEFDAGVTHVQRTNSGSTVWQWLLEAGLRRINSPNRQQHDPDFARMMESALRSGADPKVFLPTSSLTLLEFFKAYVRPNYPHEAESIHDLIFNALNGALGTNAGPRYPAIEGPGTSLIKGTPVLVKPKKPSWWKRGFK